MSQENNSAPAQTAVDTPTAIESQEAQTEQIQEVEASGEETQESSEPKTEKEKAIERKLKKLKLKVDGEEYEEEVDLDDDEYLTRQLQLAKVSQKRMNQYATLEKELVEFINELKNNPKKALTKEFIGLDLKKLASEIIEEEIENSKKTPEQIEKEKLEEELRLLKEEREREKEETSKREFERLRTVEAERYDMLMEKSLEKSDLPKSPYTVKKMAELMLIGLQNGIDLTPDDVIPLVREEMQSDLKQMFSAMPEDVIEQLIGKDVFNRVRKKNLEKARNAPKAPVKAVKDVSKDSIKKDASGKKLNMKDFFGF
jgi:hypothetical protein